MRNSLTAHAFHADADFWYFAYFRNARGRERV